MDSFWMKDSNWTGNWVVDTKLFSCASSWRHEISLMNITPKDVRSCNLQFTHHSLKRWKEFGYPLVFDSWRNLDFSGRSENTLWLISSRCCESSKWLFVMATLKVEGELLSGANHFFHLRQNSNKLSLQERYTKE